MNNLKRAALNISSKFGLLNSHRTLVLAISEERQVHETILKLVLARVNGKDLSLALSCSRALALSRSRVSRSRALALSLALSLSRSRNSAREQLFEGYKCVTCELHVQTIFS